MVRGEGDTIFDDQGQPWIDLYGGHCVCSTGHSHPKVVEAIHNQSKQLIFYSTAGELTIRREASNSLIAFSGMDTVFFVTQVLRPTKMRLNFRSKSRDEKPLEVFREVGMDEPFGPGSH